MIIHGNKIRKKFFGAGCNSLPAVESATRRCKAFTRAIHGWLIWCNSKTDSIVWMREDDNMTLMSYISGRCLYWCCDAEQIYE